MTGYIIGIVLGVLLFLSQYFKPTSKGFKSMYLITSIAFIWGFYYANLGYWHIVVIPVGEFILCFISACCFPYNGKSSLAEYEAVNGENYFARLQNEDRIGKIQPHGFKQTYDRIISGILSEIVNNPKELQEFGNLLYSKNFYPISTHTKEDILQHINACIEKIANTSKNGSTLRVKANLKVEQIFNAYVSVMSIHEEATKNIEQIKLKQMAYKGKGDMKGMLRPLTIGELSSERDPQTGERKNKTVYLVNGTIAIEPNGNGLSREGTDKTIYVYDPETGEAHELDPFGGGGVLEVGEPVSIDDYLAQNEQQSQAEVQQAADAAQGKVKEGTPFETPQGRKGIVQSIEGDNAIVLFADGEMEQASMPHAEVQQYADALRRQEYEARHTQQNQPQAPAEQLRVKYPHDQYGNVDYDKIDDADTFAMALSEEFGEDALPTLDEIIMEENDRMEKQGDVGKAKLRKRLRMLEEAKARLTPTEGAASETPTAESQAPKATARTPATSMNTAIDS